jgi:signal transduction histidine kinase/ActR/RegA family two-component response regulator
MYPASSGSEVARAEQVRAAQIRLLYTNTNTGAAATVVAALVLSYCQWAVIHQLVILGWFMFMLLVSVARYTLARRYFRAPSRYSQIAFVAGVGLAAAGWGAAAILLYPEARLIHQIFLIFVLGGMMLGGASLLAPRPEAFFVFLIPTGLLPALRLSVEGDKEHLGMGLLAAVFTIATLITTWRFYRTIESSLNLKFANYDLVRDLQAANSRSEALNEQLEHRVRQRTEELQQVAVRLRAEMEQRKQMEEELLRVRNLESLGAFAGGIAHDFNNFLTVVQGNVELAKGRLPPGTQVQEYLEQTSNACRRAALLSSQLLTFAKGGGPIRSVVSIAKVVLEIVQLARAGSAVSFYLDLAEDLWSTEVDAGQIGQAFHNILLNAKQAMPNGGSVEVRARNIANNGDSKLGSGPYVRVSIQDYGHGIPADILPRIFDPYFTTKQAGSGLGLATAHAIVARHGGRLSADSKPGFGTVFNIDLPASEVVPAPEPRASECIVRSGTGRLLVMDDEEPLRTLLEHLLKTLGYEVESACEGTQAIALYESARASGRGFDAVLLDLTVPGGMGGLETAARLKELDPSAKLIASSGYSDSPVMSGFHEYGFADVIPKPWSTAQLSAVFQRVLRAGGGGETSLGASS